MIQSSVAIDTLSLVCCGGAHNVRSGALAKASLWNEGDLTPPSLGECRVRFGGHSQ